MLHKKPLEKLSPVLTILVPPTPFVSHNYGRPLGFRFTNDTELTEIKESAETHEPLPGSAWLSLQQLSDNANTEIRFAAARARKRRRRYM